jgi:thymidine kinase
MAELTFLYAQMGAGKTAALLSTAFHLRQAGQRVLVLTTNDRVSGQVTSRVGLSAEAVPVQADTDIRSLVLGAGPVDHVLVDEAQFLAPGQVDELADLVDDHAIDVTCFGLRADFTSRLFDGAARLFATADRAEALQIQARCWCGCAATHNARTLDGGLVTCGDTVVVDDGRGGFAYEPLCRRHWRAGKTRHAVGLDPEAV